MPGRQRRATPVEVVGSGSNLLVADAGVPGLVLKLDGELTALERDGTHVLCGGGVRLPSAAAKVARWGLTGLEFGINIPGTVGGAVRMNANAYGGELAAVLEWVNVCGPGGVERRAPGELGFEYRKSNLEAGEVVSRASFALADADPEDVKATLAGMREKRREAQPSGIKTFGSTFKNPDDPRAEGLSAGMLLDAVGARGLEVRRRPLLSKARELRREHGYGDDGRHSRADGRRQAARPRALRRSPRARGSDPGRPRVARRVEPGLGVRWAGEARSPAN